MPKFRKKPVEIEAVQLLEETWEQALGWATGAIVLEYVDNDGKRWHNLMLTTVHGDQAIARHGDWIIPEPIPGRYYPCKPDIFEATYEPVEP